MNILLWVLQGLLAFWNLTGGIYTAKNYKLIRAPRVKSWPGSLWVVIGGLQVISALGLVVPALVGLPQLTFVAAIYLTVNSLSGLALAGPYAGFPGMLWGLIPAALEAFVAYGRM